MIGFALLVAAGTLLAGLVAAFGLLRLPTVRMQLTGLALVAVVLPSRPCSSRAQPCSTPTTI